MVPCLSRFGVGKRGMEDNVIEETPYLIDELTSSDIVKNLKVGYRYMASTIFRLCRPTGTFIKPLIFFAVENELCRF